MAILSIYFMMAISLMAVSDICVDGKPSSKVTSNPHQLSFWKNEARTIGADQTEQKQFVSFMLSTLRGETQPFVYDCVDQTTGNLIKCEIDLQNVIIDHEM